MYIHFNVLSRFVPSHLLHLRFFTIHCVDRALGGEDVKPNWVIVKQFQPRADLRNRVPFWQGLKQALETERKKKQRQDRRKRRPRPKPDGKIQLGIRRFCMGMKRSRVAKAKARKQLLDIEVGELEPAGSGCSESENEDPAAKMEAEAVEDILESATEKTREGDGDKAEDTAAAAADIEDTALDQLDLEQVGEAVAEHVGPSEGLPQPSSASSASRAEELVERSHRVVSDRRPATGPDLSVAVTENTELRYNALSARIVAVCKVPNHGDCRRSRTVRGAARRGIMNIAQGRPVGLLTSWLLKGAEFEDGVAHRKSIDREIPLEERKLAREHFSKQPGASEILKEERAKETNEPDEPDFIR